MPTSYAGFQTLTTCLKAGLLYSNTNRERKYWSTIRWVNQVFTVPEILCSMLSVCRCLSVCLCTILVFWSIPTVSVKSCGTMKRDLIPLKNTQGMKMLDLYSVSMGHCSRVDKLWWWFFPLPLQWLDCLTTRLDQVIRVVLEYDQFLVPNTII